MVDMVENFFEETEDDPTIWRFVDHSKFIWILQNTSLYFRRTDLMNDPYEGHPPVSYLRKNIDELQKRRERVNEKLSPDGVDGPLPPVSPDDVLAPFEHFRRSYYINCWHESELESVAMWKIYLSSGDGVAIKSNFDSLLSTIKSSADGEVSGGRMNYVDFEKSSFPHDNILRAHALKQQEYSYENEIRFSIYDPPPTKKDEHEAGDMVDYLYGEQQPGKHLCLNIEDIIDEVRISPYSPGWVDENYWENVIDKYKLDIEVSESVVTVPPKMRVQS